ncbi:MAG: sigma-54-dependent Fis family transcriptional regulator [Sphingomonadales bacterium]|nr:sigma-54-dependent Fis family transcriptional regulator [Sphingomonadales bacterium]
MATAQGVKMLMLVDDEPAQQRMVSAIAARDGWRTIFAADPETALAQLGTQDGMALDAVVIDNWGAEDEIELFVREFRVARPSLPMLVMTGGTMTEEAIAAMRAGASDIFHKPASPVRLIAALSALTEQKRHRGELRPLFEKFAADLDFDAMIGTSSAYRSALAIAAKAARARVPLMIEGEPGSGKLQLAKAIHTSSSRARGPFVTVDCASLEPALIGSCLFGHESGAFAGAFNRQDGKLLAADGGTLYIDHIELLPDDQQRMLFEAVETGRFSPLGGKQLIEVDTRIVTATSIDLAATAGAGGFREDLYYKLATVQLKVPPLRERDGDIGPLCRHFLGRFARLPNMPSLGLSEDALNLLRAYHWPGNVRQLEGVLFRAAVTCNSDAITLADLPNVQAATIVAPTKGAASQPSDGVGITLYAGDGNLRPLSEIEADVIRLAIGHYRGRMSEVARRLGIGRSTLYRKLSDLGIDTAA